MADVFFELFIRVAKQLLKDKRILEGNVQELKDTNSSLNISQLELTICWLFVDLNRFELDTLFSIL